MRHEPGRFWGSSGHPLLTAGAWWVCPVWGAMGSSGVGGRARLGHPVPAHRAGDWEQWEEEPRDAGKWPGQLDIPGLSSGSWQECTAEVG